MLYFHPARAPRRFPVRNVLTIQTEGSLPRRAAGMRGERPPAPWIGVGLGQAEDVGGDAGDAA